jgi:hypothetical protein
LWNRTRNNEALDEEPLGLAIISVNRILWGRRDAKASEARAINEDGEIVRQQQTLISINYLSE